MRGERLKVKKDVSFVSGIGVCLMAVVSLMAGCQNAAMRAEDVTGHFVMYGFGLGGQELAGTVDVEEVKDGSFSVEWVINGVDWHGTGYLTEDGKFFITYSGPDSGGGTWELMPNKELHGKWYPEGSVNFGIEVWSREDSF